MVEDLENNKNPNTLKHVEDPEKCHQNHAPSSATLSERHSQYLLQKHGTMELDPIPNMDDADPYNWPTWKKITNLALVSFHTLMATFTATSIQSVFVEISEDLGVSIQRASYLSSLMIAVLGIAPLIWMPLSDRYGRRPVFLVSLICSLAGNVGCAKSPSYATMCLCRAITAFFICPPAAIGSAVVAEVFFKKDRARYMGVWTVMLALGVPLAPLIFGFVATRVGYRWIYWILAITNAMQFIVYLVLGPETLYVRDTTDKTHASTIRRRFLTLRRINPEPLGISDFVEPLRMAARPCVMVPAVVYSMVFLLANILIAFQFPEIFPGKFHFNEEQVGLQFLSIIIGSIIGEPFGGYFSDRWMSHRTRTIQRPTAPEYRLWLMYPGLAMATIGLVVFLVQIDNASSHWNISPVIGATIAAVGIQIITTISITYAVDCYRSDAASIGVFINFVRQIWGFIGPFWFPQMLENVGYIQSSGICVALIVAFSVIPTIWLQWKGYSWR